ncbi:MAG: YlbF family regulator [Chloroflexota bacterium]
MTLDKELKQAAENMGHALREHEAVRAFLDAQEALNADAEMAALDRQHQEMYDSLIARQRAGEQLTNDEIETFQTLRKRVQGHPLVMARDMALNDAKSFLVNVGYDLSMALGLDYPALVLA